MKKKNRTKKPSEQDLRLALLKISEMGARLKPEMVDWQNIGKSAVSLAKEVLREKCVECGK